MNVNLTNLITSAAAALAMTSSALASKPVQMKDNGCPCTPFEQGMPLTSCESFPPAYNAPARTEVRCSWDVFLTASFLYWLPNQEGMDIGYNSGISAGNLLPPNNGLVVSQNGTYLPGFKVGIGANFDLDHWVGYVEYTWLHGSNGLSLNGGTDTRTANGLGVIVFGTWYSPNTGDPTNNTGNSSSTKWRVNLDILDATMSRPYYEGRNLTINPFFGARALWLRQNMRLSSVMTNANAQNPAVSHNQSRSWALGPRAGMQSHWQLGWGFRLEGDAAASLVFQRYTKIAHRSDTLDSTSDIAAANFVSAQNYGALRPILDMGLGIGWGSYLDCQNFYFDLAANYDFMYLWGQNVMRQLNDETYVGVAGTPGALFYQGLTLTARLDF